MKTNDYTHQVQTPAYQVKFTELEVTVFIESDVNHLNDCDDCSRWEPINVRDHLSLEIIYACRMFTM